MSAAVEKRLIQDHMASYQLHILKCFRKGRDGIDIKTAFTLMHTLPAWLSVMDPWYLIQRHYALMYAAIEKRLIQDHTSILSVVTYFYVKREEGLSQNGFPLMHTLFPMMVLSLTAFVLLCTISVLEWENTLNQDHMVGLPILSISTYSELENLAAVKVGQCDFFLWFFVMEKCDTHNTSMITLTIKLCRWWHPST